MQLSVNNISVAFGFNVIFHKLSFCLQQGKILQISGPNGVGKSVLLGAIDGAYIPFHGDITNSFNSKILINQNNAIKRELLVREQLQFWQGLTRQTLKMPDDWGLSELIDAPIEYLSLGQKQRLALSKLDILDADLWLLDEPYHGLDQDGQTILNNKIKQKISDGGAVIIVNHNKLALPVDQVVDMSRDNLYVAA